MGDASFEWDIEGRQKIIQNIKQWFGRRGSVMSSQESLAQMNVLSSTTSFVFGSIADTLCSR